MLSWMIFKKDKIMNNEYKKGFMESIDGVLNILKESQEEFVHEDEINIIYYTKLIEAKVLKLKISFFENYYNSDKENNYLEETPEETLNRVELLKKIRDRNQKGELKFFGIEIPEEDSQDEKQ